MKFLAAYLLLNSGGSAGRGSSTGRGSSAGRGTASGDGGELGGTLSDQL